MSSTVEEIPVNERVDAKAPAAKKAVKPNANPKPCKYGKECRCQHPQHLADFTHN
jgi:hypothetical protein